MSHFSVIIATANKPTNEDLEHILAPFQEYDGQYNHPSVEFVDETEEFRLRYTEHCESSENPHPTFKEYLNNAWGLPLVELPLLAAQEESHVLIENGEVSQVLMYTNPQGYWDWWVIGGRYSDKFLSKTTGLYTDSIKVEDLNLEYLTRRSVDEALEIHRAHLDIVGPMDGFRTWKDVRESVEDIQEARSIYHDQPQVQRWQDWSDDANNTNPHKHRYLFGDLSELLRTEEQVEQDAFNTAVSCFAYIDLDRKWNAQGQMLMFGMSDNTMENCEWWAHVRKWIENLPKNAYITTIDCHV